MGLLPKQNFHKILITGATSGIGLACAKLFAEKSIEKSHLILTGRRKNRLESITKELNSSLVTVHPFAFDIQNRKEVEDFLSTNKTLLEDTDILINNAGLASGMEDFAHANIDDWETMIDTNIKGLLYITHGILPFMMSRHSGHIVNIGSIAGRSVYPKGSVYCATKHAVRAINDSLRIDTLGSGVKVSSVDPGMVETEFSLVRFKGDEEKAKSIYHGLTPLSPEDVAESVYWCTSQPKHVNVQEILLMPTDQASVRDVYRK